MPLSFWAGYFEKLAIVALALTALYLLARKLRHAQFPRDGRSVSLLETTMLSQHAALHVVRAGSRHFLIGSSAGGVSRIAELRSAQVDGSGPIR